MPRKGKGIRKGRDENESIERRMNGNHDVILENNEKMDVSGDENTDNEERAMKVKRIRTEEDKCIRDKRNHPLLT